MKKQTTTGSLLPTCLAMPREKSAQQTD